MEPKATIRPALRRRVIERDGIYCRYCGFGPMRLRWGFDQKGRLRLYMDLTGPDLGTMLTLDHRRCEASGGATTAANLVVSCARCNQRKATKRAASSLLPRRPVCLLPAPIGMPPEL
jgi:hypothetical protein